MTIDPVIAGAIATAVGAIVAAGIRGDWVWGRELRAANKQVDYWKRAATRAQKLTDASLDEADEAVPDGP